MSLATDALGWTLALTSSTGALNTMYVGACPERSRREPFGNTTAFGPANSNPYQFTGRENDGSGLYFYRARYYSPTLQRFIAQDPIGFAGGDPNLYEYVVDDPVNLDDPSGLLNVIVGGGGSLVGVTGAEGSGGIFIKPGLFGQQANAGVFGTAGAGGGVNVSADVFGGVIFGGAENVSGPTLDVNLVLGPISVTLLTNPDTGEVVGITVGLGPSATPVGASGTFDVTGVLSVAPIHPKLCQ